MWLSSSSSGNRGKNRSRTGPSSHSGFRLPPLPRPPPRRTPMACERDLSLLTRLVPSPVPLFGALDVVVRQRGEAGLQALPKRQKPLFQVGMRVPIKLCRCLHTGRTQSRVQCSCCTRLGCPQRSRAGAIAGPAGDGCFASESTNMIWRASSCRAFGSHRTNLVKNDGWPSRREVRARSPDYPQRGTCTAL
jgi:hypothetical protein